MRRASVAAGSRFGRWRVIAYAVPSRNGQTRVLCTCDCGVDRVVALYHLQAELSRSCGCLREELRRKHGASYTRLYRVWLAMLQRCENPRASGFVNYGGRGITVCRRWRDFETFAADVGARPSPRHTLGRKNNNKGYCPSNVQWETPLQQARNTRRNNFITVGGIRRCVSEWAARLGTTPFTLYRRRKLGWSWRRTVLTPIRQTHRRAEIARRVRQKESCI